MQEFDEAKVRSVSNALVQMVADNSISRERSTRLRSSEKMFLRNAMVVSLEQEGMTRANAALLIDQALTLAVAESRLAPYTLLVRRDVRLTPDDERYVLPIHEPKWREDVRRHEHMELWGARRLSPDELAETMQLRRGKSVGL